MAKNARAGAPNMFEGIMKSEGIVRRAHQPQAEEAATEKVPESSTVKETVETKEEKTEQKEAVITETVQEQKEETVKKEELPKDAATVEEKKQPSTRRTTVTQEEPGKKSQEAKARFTVVCDQYVKDKLTEITLLRSLEQKKKIPVNAIVEEALLEYIKKHNK